MLATILLVLFVPLSLFSSYVALMPGNLTVERSTVIAAPTAAVFPEVNNLKKWDAWSPWAKKDPAARTTYSGPPEGKGAHFGWAGNKEVGEGSMTILDAKPDESIDIRLVIKTPFPGESNVSFRFAPEGDKTRVTWRLDCEQGIVERAITTAMRVDVARMIGTEYEKGLASLKAVVEGKAR